VTRAEALDWWRRGYQAGAAAAARRDPQEAAHRAAVARWHQQRQARLQAAVAAGLDDLIHLIAQAAARRAQRQRAHRLARPGARGEARRAAGGGEPWRVL
jgi:hypothetical protein